MVSRASPQVHQGVGAPGAPGRRAALGGGGVARDPEPVEAVPDTEIGGQEDIGVAERAHADVAGRPRADAGHGLQRGVHLVAVGPAVEVDLPGGEGAAQVDQGLAAPARHRQGSGVGVGERVGGRELVGEPVCGQRQRLAELGHEPSGQGARAARPTPAGRGPPAPRSRPRRPHPARGCRGGGAPAGRAAGHDRGPRRRPRSRRRGRAADGSGRPRAPRRAGRAATACTRRGHRPGSGRRWPRREGAAARAGRSCRRTSRRRAPRGGRGSRARRRRRTARGPAGAGAGCRAGASPRWTRDGAARAAWWRTPPGRCR